MLSVWGEACCILYIIVLNTPTLLEHVAPSSLSSSACGCSVWTLCRASFPELSSSVPPPCKGSSAPSASSHTEPSAPGATPNTHTHTSIHTCCVSTKHIYLRYLCRAEKKLTLEEGKTCKESVNIRNVLPFIQLLILVSASAFRVCVWLVNDIQPCKLRFFLANWKVLLLWSKQLVQSQLLCW